MKRKLAIMFMTFGLLFSSFTAMNIPVYAVGPTQEGEQTIAPDPETRKNLESNENEEDSLEAPVSQFTTFSVSTVGTNFNYEHEGNTLRYRILTLPNTNVPGTVCIPINPNPGSGVASTGSGLVGSLNVSGKLVIPEIVPYNDGNYSVVEIEAYALELNTLTDLVLPSSLKKIGRQSLASNQLTTLNLPEGLEKIGEMAIYDCKKLKSITIPSTVNEMGNSVFQGSAAIEVVYLKPSSPNNITFKQGVNGGTTRTFQGISSSSVLFIVENKAAFTNWWTLASSAKFMTANQLYTLTYVMDMVYRDRNGKELTNVTPKIKKLYFQSPNYVYQNEKWTIINGALPEDSIAPLPNLADIGYTANFWGVGPLPLVLINSTRNVQLSNLSTIQSIGKRILSSDLYAIEKPFDFKSSVTIHSDGSNSLYINADANPITLVDDQIWLNIKAKSATDNKDYGLAKLPFEQKHINVADNGEYTLSYDIYNSVLKKYTAQQDGENVTFNIPVKTSFNTREVISLPTSPWTGDNSVFPLIMVDGTGVDINLYPSQTIKWDPGQITTKGFGTYNYTITNDNLVKQNFLNTAIQAKNYADGLTSSGSADILFRIKDSEWLIKFLDYDNTLINKQVVLTGNDAVLPSVPSRKGYKFTGWLGQSDRLPTNITKDTYFVAQYVEAPLPPEPPKPEPTFSPTPTKTPKPVPSPTLSPTPTTSATPNPADKKNTIVNPDMGIKIETSNKDKIFNVDSKIFVVNLDKEEIQKVSKTLDYVIKVFDVVLEENGVRVEKLLDSKVRISLDAEDYKDYENIVIYQKDKNGNYVQLVTTLEDGKITFECDALDTYVLTGTKKAISTNVCSVCGFCPEFLGICIFIWLFILVLVGLIIIVIKRKQKTKQLKK